MEDLVVERCPQRGRRNRWRIRHVPSGEVSIHTYATKREALAWRDRLIAEPVIFYVAYPTRKTLGHFGQVWESEKFTNEDEARAFAARKRTVSVERLTRKGTGYEVERITF